MSEFTPEQERRLAELMNSRLKSTRHENADHLDNALLPVKIKPGTVGSVLTTISSTGNQPGLVAWSFPAIVSALPASPVDGQDCFYQSSAMATDGIVWHLKYRSGGGTYKWEAVGASVWTKRIATGENLASTSYGALATVGPTIALPLTGEYAVTVAATIIPSAINLRGYVTPDVAGNAASDANAARFQAYAASVESDVAKPSLVTCTTPGNMTIQYRCNGATNVQFSNRVITAVPIRVG